MSDGRRGFIKFFTSLLGTLVGAVVTIPGIALLAHPLRRDTVNRGKTPLRVAKLAEIKPGKPLRVDVTGELVDAWSRQPNVKLGSCWLVKSSDRDTLQAFSTVCPHLGCGLDWSESDRRFVCPCHDSFFGLDGTIVTGPSPRAMDELDVTVESEEVKVLYRRFRIGLPTKEEV